jgi:hypothetical protein
MARLFYSRFGAEDFQECATVQEAAGIAIADVEWNEAYPLRIEENGAIVWRNRGLFSASYDDLERLNQPPPDPL